MNYDKEFDELEKIDSVQLMDFLKKSKFEIGENKSKQIKLETNLMPSIYNDNFTIREFDSEDNLQLSELNKEFNLIMQEFDPLYDYSNNVTFLDNRENIIYVAEIDGKITGYLLARFYTGYFQRDDHICYLAKIYVLPQYRKQNIGKTLINYLYDYANSKGSEKITALVMPENIIAEHFFEQLDFIRIGKEGYTKDIQKVMKK